MNISRNSNPWYYVPTLYFAEGLPYIIVNAVSAVMYKKMGLSNQFIGLTSILYLPWVIKMLWSPVVDVYATRRSWLLACQLLLALCFACLAFSLSTDMFVPLTLTAFTVIAFISATHDIAVDGYYMLALDKEKQAFFIGIRSLFYRFAVIFGQGLLVILAGTIEKKSGSITLSWVSAMAVPAAVFLAAFLFHRTGLPCPAADRAKTLTAQKGFREAFITYFCQDKIIPVVLFILLYRLGESMLAKMAAPFLLDPESAGGLGLATDTFGYIYGTAGVISLAAGGIIGGFLISKFGLKRCIWPMAILLNAPDIFYVYMAMVKPGLATVCFMVVFEQFGYGLGFTAFSVFLMYLAKEPYKTSHFAISTGLMALGMMVPGMVSGFLQNAMGYSWFFVMVLVLTLPGMGLLFFIPLDNSNET